MSQIHEYIADATQCKGFRDGTITQVWVPIDFSSMGSWWAHNTIKRVYQPGTGHWAVEAECNFRLYEGGFNCPYAVGDVLTVGVRPFPDEPGQATRTDFIVFPVIASVEAKTLDQITFGEMRDFGTPEPPETDEMHVVTFTNTFYALWNDRYPDQPWDSKRWCWKVAV